MQPSPHFRPFLQERSHLGKLLPSPGHSQPSSRRSVPVKDLKLARQLASEEDLCIIQKGPFLMFSRFHPQKYVDCNIVPQPTPQHSSLNPTFESIPLQNKNSYLHSIYKEGLAHRLSPPQSPCPALSSPMPTHDSLSEQPHKKFRRTCPYKKDGRKQVHSHLLKPLKYDGGPAVGNYDINYGPTQKRTIGSRINTEQTVTKKRQPPFLKKTPGNNINILEYKRHFTSMIKKDRVINEFSNILREVDKQAQGMRESHSQDMPGLGHGHLQDMHMKMNRLMKQARQHTRNYQNTKYTALNKQYN